MGGFSLEAITNPPETNWSEHVHVPVYRHEDYLDALERHYRECGIAFDRSKFECAPVKRKPTIHEPPVPSFPDPTHVPVTLTVMKNNKVKVVAHTAWHALWERYFNRGKAPPLRALVQGYKAIGCDDDFLKNIIKSHDTKIKHHAKLFAKHIQKVFDKAKKVVPVKKKAKVEVAAVVVEEDAASDAEEDDEAEEDDDDGPVDEEGFDMEIGDDEDVVDDDVVLSDVEL